MIDLCYCKMFSSSSWRVQYYTFYYFIIFSLSYEPKKYVKVKYSQNKAVTAGRL